MTRDYSSMRSRSIHIRWLAPERNPTWAAASLGNPGKGASIQNLV
jgi:hypothetical protein